MNNQDIINLGWKLRHKISNQNHIHYKKDEYIMAVLFNYDDGFNLIMIKDIEGITCNVWENSSTLFYGLIKTPKELNDIMRYIGVIEY